MTIAAIAGITATSVAATITDANADIDDDTTDDVLVVIVTLFIVFVVFFVIVMLIGILMLAVMFIVVVVVMLLGSFLMLSSGVIRILMTRALFHLTIPSLHLTIARRFAPSSSLCPI